MAIESESVKFTNFLVRDINDLRPGENEVRVTVEQMEKWMEVLEPEHAEVDHQIPQPYGDAKDEEYVHHTVLWTLNDTGIDRVFHASQWAPYDQSTQVSSIPLEYTEPQIKLPIVYDSVRRRGANDEEVTRTERKGVSSEKFCFTREIAKPHRKRCRGVSNEMPDEDGTPPDIMLASLISSEKGPNYVGFVGNGPCYPMSSKDFAECGISVKGGYQEHRVLKGQGPPGEMHRNDNLDYRPTRATHQCDQEVT